VYEPANRNRNAACSQQFAGAAGIVMSKTELADKSLWVLVGTWHGGSVSSPLFRAIGWR